MPVLLKESIMAHANILKPVQASEQHVWRGNLNFVVVLKMETHVNMVSWPLFIHPFSITAFPALGHCGAGRYPR